MKGIISGIIIIMQSISLVAAAASAIVSIAIATTV
jgi:hypothetical protein